MKRAVAIILTFVLIVNVMVVGAYAANEEDLAQIAAAESLIVSFENTSNNANLSRTTVRTVKNDLSLLEVSHLDKLVEISNIDSSGNVSYRIDFDNGITNYISVSSNDAGDVILNVQEGSIVNELIYAADGAIYLDGAPAFDSAWTNRIEDKERDSAFNITPRAGVTTDIFAINLPYGNGSIPSTFTRVNSATGTPYSLTKALGLIAVGAIISLAVSYLTGPVVLWSALSQAVVSGVLLEALTRASNQFAALKVAHPNATRMNYKMYLYAKNGNNSLYAEHIYSFYLYAAEDNTFDGDPVYAGAKKVMAAT